MVSGGIGKSVAEASRMSFAEIENLLRPPDDKGNPDNPEVRGMRAISAAKKSREARLGMQAAIDAQEAEKRTNGS